MIDTIIFDLDGTLLNTLEDLKDSTNFALRYFGYPECSIDEVLNFVGNGVKKLIERAIPQGLDNPNFERCLDIFKTNYAENMYNNTVPYDGVIDMLETLRNKGIKIAVVSNKFDMAVKTLCRNYFANLVQVAVGESDNIRKKPSPDGVFRAIKLLNSSDKNSIYCGDSDVDVNTAKNAGLDCIGVTWGFRDRKVLISEGASYIVDTPDEILKILLI